MYNIAIFASGGGSNAESIIKHFQDSSIAKVSLILSNKPEAFVLQRAKNHNLASVFVSPHQLRDSEFIMPILQQHKIDFIALAGFLLLIPSYLIKAFPRRIVNIHPALLPKYGGKGMYGSRVHQAVFDNFEKESGPRIHYVDENYDEGQIIFQKSAALEVTDTPDVIAKKVLAIEHAQYGQVIESVLREMDRKRMQSDGAPS